MIQIQDIKKAFGEKAVLKGVSSTFQKGQTNLIIGGSGTGKSVLMKTMIGLIKPDSGRVLYDGREFYESGAEVQQAIRREMGVLFQGGALFDSQTVEQNVRFPLDMLTNQPMDEKQDRVAACLKRVGLEGTGNRMPSEISGGMKKRVGIARAIVMNPMYLFCDEPNSGLDPLTAVKIDALIQEITEEYDITTVIITHDMNSVMEIGQNIVFLYQGDKLWEGGNEDIVRSTVPELREFLFANKLLREMEP
ncbi:ABC transporter ATP-binding protein [Dyadobacter tibetensis]|uniref:ABC transporter ATP-binding protein n=1 Tax=Dyadobacter tibetensis TaxID=1211851 RepID=UPI000472DD7A|nr:ATP-binding cassette domain-containing protein [Dyadobacter tibetensis]